MLRLFPWENIFQQQVIPSSANSLCVCSSVLCVLPNPLKTRSTNQNHSSPSVKPTGRPSAISNRSNGKHALTVRMGGKNKLQEHINTQKSSRMNQTLCPLSSPDLTHLSVVLTVKSSNLLAQSTRGSAAAPIAPRECHIQEETRGFADCPVTSPLPGAKVPAGWASTEHIPCRQLNPPRSRHSHCSPSCPKHIK